MTAQAAAAPGGVPPIVLDLEAAQRRHRTNFRTRFILTWFVILGAVGFFLSQTPAVKIDPGFIAEWLPFIIGGVWITLFISVVFDHLRGDPGGLRSPGPDVVEPLLQWRRVALRLDRPRDAAHRPDPVHLPRPAGRRDRPRSAADRDHRPVVQLRRLSDRGLPGRHPGGSRGPGRGGARARTAGSAS